jgi:hypothetical protein
MRLSIAAVLGTTGLAATSLLGSTAAADKNPAGLAKQFESLAMEAVANVDAATPGSKATTTFRLLAIYEKTGTSWRVVHLSFATPNEARE